MSKYGYIYIGGDRSKGQQAKVGKTTRKPDKRISETTNPDYYLYHFYKVPIEELSKSEVAIHREISKKYKRIKFVSSNRNSEWFECSTQEADDICGKYFETLMTLEKKELDRKAKIESFQEDKREVLSHFTYYYGPLLSDFSQLEKAYNKKRKKLEKELLPRHQTSFLNYSEILGWCFSTGVTAFVPAFLIHIFAELDFSTSFVVCFVILGIIERGGLNVTKTVTDQKALKTEVDKCLPTDLFRELKAMISKLNSYEQTASSLPLNGKFPTLPFRPEDLVEPLQQLSKNLTCSDSNETSTSQKTGNSRDEENFSDSKSYVD